MGKFISPPGSGEQQALPTAQLNVNPSDLEDVKCKCGNYTFHEVILLKHMPALISPTGKSGYIPMKAFTCVVCNTIPKELHESLGGWFKRPDSNSPKVNEEKIEGSKLPGLEIVMPGDKSGKGK